MHPTSYKFSRLDPQRTKAWAKQLVQKNEKGQKLQQDFLIHLLMDSVSFAGYVEESIRSALGPQADSFLVDTLLEEPPSLLASSASTKIEFTPGHLYMMPPEDKLKFYSNLVLPIKDAESSFFWGALTLKAIREKIIKPHWLAATGNNNETCQTIVAKVSKAIKDPWTKTSDDIVRRVIRSLTAPGEYRGAPELYADCSFAKSWWCVYYSKMCHLEIAKHTSSISLDDIVSALSSVWNDFATTPSRLLTILAEPPIAAGFAFWAVAEDRKEALNTNRAKIARNTLGEISARVSLLLSNPPEIKTMIVTEMKNKEKAD